MARGDRIFAGVSSGRLYLQEDSLFTENHWGFDDGMRRYLTHPNTNQNNWPQRFAVDPEGVWKRMYVTDVIPREDASGLIELTVLLRGVMRFTNGVMKERILPSADVAMFALPALSGGNPARVIAPVPKPSVSREYVTLTQPKLTGVSLALSGTWLPSLPDFIISYIPNPDEPMTLNYSSGWKLDDRSWQDVAKKVYLVREFASYYYSIAV